jgi:PIN domain nuclease of toxin-antitoxin system
MRLLLDSHAFLWFCEGSFDLSKTAREAIEDIANEKWISHATAWELAIKLSIGKLKIAGAYADLFQIASRQTDSSSCPRTFSITSSC